LKLPNSKFWQIRFSLILALLSSWGLEVSTQESTESTSQTPPEIALTQSGLSLNSNLVKSELTQLEENKEIEAGLKETLTSLYQTALQRLEQAATYEATTEQIRNLINTGPENVKSIQSKLDSLPSVTGSNAFTNHLAGISPEASSKDLVQILTTDKLQHADLKNQTVALESELQTQKERPEKNRLEQQEAKKRLNEITLSLQANAPEAEKPIERKAREISLEAQRLARTLQLNMLEQESLSHEMRQNQLRVSRDLKQRELDLLNARIKALEIESNKRREAEAEQARKEAIKAKRETLLKAPLIVNLAETNTVLTAELSGLATQLSRLNPKQEVLKQQLAKISSDFNSISNQIHIGGVDRALVEILLDQRRRLPRLNILQREKTELEIMIKTNRLARFKVDTSLNNLPSPESLVRNAHTLSNTNEINTEMVFEVEKLLDQKKVYLNELNTNYGSLIDRLRNVNADYETKLQVVSRYRMFLDEKLMWVPTSTTILEWNKAPWLETSKWLLNSKNWEDVSSSIGKIIIQYPVQSAGIFLISGSLLGFRRRLQKYSHAATQNVRRISTDSFWFTSRVVLITFLLALALPLPITYLGFQLIDPVIESDFARSVGFGAIFLSCNILVLR
jgi:potassium efflux system protein